VEDEGLFGFANGLSGAMDMILDHVSLGELEQIEYDNDPPAYLRSLAQYAGASALDNALHAMGSTVEIAALYDRIVNNIRPGTTAGDMPSLDDGMPVLQLRQLDLSAHHLYGSSRLGIANYWPGQHSRIWNYTTNVVDTFRLGVGRPWYSGAYNDVIEREKTTPYGFGLQSPTLAQNVLGQKQYELSNHLGNVQATVSDARYVTGSGAGLKFKNSIVAAYDYYPFGMLMPDRFVTDTGQRSATVTQVVLAPRLVNTPVDMNVGAPDDSLYITWFPTIKYASGYGGNIHWTSSVVPQEPVEVTVDLRYVFGYTTVRVSEYVNGVWQIRANGFANYPGPVTLPGFTPTTNQIRISIGTDVMYVNSQVLFTLYSIGVSRMTMVPQLMATTIHNVDKDRYAFGFNGQMKDNEVAGMGNHNTAEFWEYDTRTARRWNLDPKPHIGISDYSTFGGNPIFNADPNGDYFTETEGGNGLKRLEMLKNKANDRIEKYRNELANVKPNSDKAKYLQSLIDQTQGILNKVAEMEKSNIEFHIGTGKEAKSETAWNPFEKRVDVGSQGAGVNGPSSLGVFPHELEHGYQFLSGELAGYFGSPSNPLYDLSDEYNAAWNATLLSDGVDFTNWHSTPEGRSYEEYKTTETGPKSGHPFVSGKTTPISVKSSAAVLLEVKGNILAGSASQVLRTNPQATVGDAISYYNNFQEAHKMPNRILTGKALEKRK
jgi:hypothetical protein